MKEKRKGKLIVLEGTDGSGKATQTKLLIESLRARGIDPYVSSFPQYGKKSAGLVEEYLNGSYGDVNPYAASLFYALDRFDASFEISKALEKGKVAILDRYVDSNAGHQGGKIKNPAKRREFLKWLYSVEYEILGIPEPDMVVILHVPAKIGYALVGKKDTRGYIKKGKRDAHEANLAHLEHAENSYLWLAKEFPKNHKVIECAIKNQLLSPDQIHQKIMELITPFLKK